MFTLSDPQGSTEMWESGRIFETCTEQLWRQNEINIMPMINVVQMTLVQDILSNQRLCYHITIIK